jgi:Firmicute plasmid replication protein (RepL)
MSVTRYKTNPFLKDMVLNLKEKQVRLSKLGKDNNVLINQETNETFGTHVVTHRYVDSEQFVKLFTRNIALTFDLTSTGIKAFNVLCWTVQNGSISKDEVALDGLTHEEFMAAHTNWTPPLKLSLPTFKRGLAELEKSKLIAKTARAGRYFVNPNFVFNGDRVVFSTVIEKREKNKIAELEARGQQRLVD